MAAFGLYTVPCRHSPRTHTPMTPGRLPERNLLRMRIDLSEASKVMMVGWRERGQREELDRSRERGILAFYLPQEEPRRNGTLSVPLDKNNETRRERTVRSVYVQDTNHS